MKKILVTTMILVSGSIFIGVLFFGIIYSPNGEISTTTVRAQSETTGHPTRFYIPTLKIDATVKEVGITKNGNIASPRNFSDVGWYKYGILPGEIGTSIIDGHVDNGLALPGVFSDLKNIKIGDNVYVETEENKVLNFVVEKIEVFDYNAGTESIITEGKDFRLVLITCTGNWMPNLRTHDQRLVVTTVLVN